MSWSTEKIAGHAVDYFEPTEPNQHGYVVLYLHGVHLGRLVENAVFTEQFERHGLRVVAPMTQRSWWTDRICPEFDPNITAERHVRDNVLPAIAERYGTRPPRVGLLGTSMGGQGALRLAFKHPDTFPVVAALAPAIDYQLRWGHEEEGATLPRMYADAESVRQDTATLHIHPLYWPRNTFFCCDPGDRLWYESSERLHMKLAALGVPHQCDLETEAGGHGIHYYNAQAPRAVGWLVEALEKERRRG